MWTVFALACVALFYYTYHATAVLPSGDEWFVLSWLTGEKPVTLQWLWSQHNEHRVFLPRVFLLVLSWHSNCDEKLMTSCLALLGCVSAFLVIQGLRTIRGRTSYLDIVPALALIHWGHANYHCSFQLALVLPVFLFVLLVSALLAWLERPEKATLLTAAAAMLALPLCGGCMLPAACLFGLYFVYCGWRIYAGERRKWFALTVALFPLVTYALVVFYFVDYHRPERHLPSPGLWASFQGGLAALSHAFGVFPRISVWLALLLLLASATVLGSLVLKAIRDPRHRERCIVLLLAGGSILVLAFCIGYSRIGISYPKTDMRPHYITLISPLFFVLWAGFAIVHRASAQPFLQVVLACLALMTMGVDYQDGYQRMRATQRRNKRILVDAYVMNKSNAELIAADFPPGRKRQIVLTGMDGLRAKGLGVFGPRVFSGFRKSHRPHLDNKARLDALRSWMNNNQVPYQVSFNRDGVAGCSLLAHPASRATLQVPGNASKIQVEFGIYPAAYKRPNKPDGAGFRICVRGRDGKLRKIWSRYLNPVAAGQDRGAQRATIPIPPLGAGAKLVLETLPGKSRFRDWAYWSDFLVLDKNGNALDLPPRLSPAESAYVSSEKPPNRPPRAAGANAAHRLARTGPSPHRLEKLENPRAGFEAP